MRILKFSLWNIRENRASESIRNSLVYHRAFSAELYVIFAYEFIHTLNFVYKKRSEINARAVFCIPFMARPPFVCKIYIQDSRFRRIVSICKDAGNHIHCCRCTSPVGARKPVNFPGLNLKAQIIYIHVLRGEPVKDRCGFCEDIAFLVKSWYNSNKFIIRRIKLMVILPKVRGFICTTAHPAGCEANVRAQIQYVKSQPKTKGAKKVLVIGASMGYGLASRIAAAYSCDAATIGVIFDKPGTDSKPGSAGWYNTAAFEKAAAEDGLYAKTINGDAYSKEIKDSVIELIKKDFGKIDMLIYSMAAPRRAMADGTVYSSVLKTTGDSYTNKTIDLRTKEITEVTIPPANEEEILATVKVMGGEDWMDWIEALKAADAIEEEAVTLAYSYIGPELTHPVYMDGSIGKAKDHLFATSKAISEKFPGIKALISVNKALVTQSSAAIPIVPLYISILYKIMKAQGIHEGCIEQMYRMIHDKLFGEHFTTDEEGRIRMDDLEMRPEIQNEITKIWEHIDSETLEATADIDGYWEDFYKLFGFNMPGVDYEADVLCAVPIPSIGE